MLEVDSLSGDIVMDRGDYFDPEFTIVDQNGTPLDVSDPSVAMTLTVKASLDDPITSAIFQLTRAAGQFDVTGATQGLVKAKGPETLTQPLAGDYVYDFEIMLSAKTRTVAKAAGLFIRKDVTDVVTVVAPPSVLAGFPGGYLVTLPYYTYKPVSAGGDGLYHKWDLVFDAGSGEYLIQRVATSATPPPF